MQQQQQQHALAVCLLQEETVTQMNHSSSVTSCLLIYRLRYSSCYQRDSHISVIDQMSALCCVSLWITAVTCVVKSTGSFPIGAPTKDLFIIKYVLIYVSSYCMGTSKWLYIACFFCWTYKLLVLSVHILHIVLMPLRGQYGYVPLHITLWRNWTTAVTHTYIHSFISLLRKGK